MHDVRVHTHKHAYILDCFEQHVHYKCLLAEASRTWLTVHGGLTSPQHRRVGVDVVGLHVGHQLTWDLCKCLFSLQVIQTSLT